MVFRAFSRAAVICVLFTLTGCTLLPLKKLQPTIAPPDAEACSTMANLIKSVTSPTFGYLLPVDVGATSMRTGFVVDTPDSGSARTVLASVPTFDDYDAVVAERVRAKMGDELSKDPVVVAFRKILESVSAEAQLDAQIADKTTEQARTDVAAQFAAIHKQKLPSKLSHTQLKTFSNKLFALQLKKTAADVTTSNPHPGVVAAAKAAHSELTQTTAAKPTFDAAFVAYLKAYYNGTFYDRMSTAISKPKLPTSVSDMSNFSVPDSEIVAAETVLLEFLMDLIDPTPVMGNTACPLPATAAYPSTACTPAAGDKTTYYPGGSTNQPTALTVGLAPKYIDIQNNTCGFTPKNVWVLKTLASAASDEAATVGGLVANTPGGISIGLGVVGKISIGDNATLSDLVKTAGSELALRATLVTSYFSLYRLRFTPIDIP